MKFLFAFLFAATMMTASGQAQERPALPLEKAVAIAVDYLKTIGKDKEHWIASISYDRTSMTNPTYTWFVKWGPPINLGGRKELGLEISMNGEVARAVDKKK